MATFSPPSRITVLISGSGTNLQALIDASTRNPSSDDPSPPALPHVQFSQVISDRKDAYGLKRACAAGIPTHHHSIVPYKTLPDDPSNPQASPRRQAYDAALATLILAEKPDIVVCAGFMRIVTPALLTPLREAHVPIINLHPALHGDLVGARCIERAWEEFREGKRTATGAMVHFVIPEVDMGEMIVQREVSIVGCEKLEDLQGRIQEAEHRLIVVGTREGLSRGRE